MSNLTVKEQEIINKHLTAFNGNFENITIEKHNRFYYIFKDKPDYINHNWIYSSNNIHEINGWLYGAVQAVNILKRLV